MPKTAEKQRNKFWNFALADGSSAATLYIYGEIAADAWTAWVDDDVYPKQFADELESLGDVTEINVRINSIGGEIFAAQTIYNLLKQHAATVTTYIDGLAASAASIIAMAADEVVMAGNAMLMIHNPFVYAGGDGDQLRAYADMADQLRDTIVTVYADKTGLPTNKLAELMQAETWMGAAEAQRLGFVDTIATPISVTNVAGSRYAINGLEVDLAAMNVWPGALLATAKAKPDAEEPEEPVAEPDAEEPEEPGEPEEAEEPEEPDQTADPVAAERKRVQGIMALTCPGAEEIINTAIANGTAPGDVAQAILKSGVVKNAVRLASIKNDAPSPLPAEPEDPSRNLVNKLVDAIANVRGKPAQKG